MSESARIPLPRPSVATAVTMLALCCVFWGFSFPAMKLGLGSFERQVLPGAEQIPLPLKLAIGATFNAWRFGGAAILYWLMTRRRQRRFNKTELVGGTTIGLFFAAGMFLQIVGLHYTLPSVSSFLTALVVVFAPLGQALLFRRRVDAVTWLAVGLALTGMVTLSQPNPDAAPLDVLPPVPPFPFAGEILTVLGALCFTGQILSVDHYCHRADTVRLTLIMFVVTAIFSGILSLSLGAHAIYPPAVLGRLLNDHTLQWALPAMTLFSSVLALHWMNAYQPRISPAMASVVYCLEPIFGTLFSIVFGTELLTGFTVVGGSIILLALLVVTKRSDQKAEAESVAQVGLAEKSFITLSEAKGRGLPKGQPDSPRRSE